jgi:hypothetical protein
MNRIIILFSFVVSLALFACQSRIKDDKEVILARVHNNYLTNTDLSGIVPENTLHRDSIVLIRNYVNNWIKSQLMVEKAKFNLTDDQLDFEKRLEEYENSLIIFEYESKLIGQELDTTISETELRTFYQDHSTDFELKENIVRVYYLVLEKDHPEKELVENTFNLADSLIIDSIENLSIYYNFTAFLDTSLWVSFDDLKRRIPIETYNQELFLKHKRTVKISDETNFYLLKFVDFKITDEISPYDLIKKNIRDIILAKRKIALIKKVRQEIFDQAALNNDFEIYYHE